MKANLNKYYIYTDSASEEIKARTLSKALAQWGEAPKSVTTAAAFEAWLAKSGGYGGIRENDVQIAYYPKLD